jgi:hypothetical protein
MPNDVVDTICVTLGGAVDPLAHAAKPNITANASQGFA